jgi:hypothetical protein
MLAVFDRDLVLNAKIEVCVPCRALPLSQL